MADNPKQPKRPSSRQRELSRARRRRRKARDAHARRQQQDADASPERPAADKPKLKESDITGLKYFDKLAPLLERLHDDACQRDKAGNRQLHFDQYCMLILLYLFNPIVDSLRGIQQASELGKVQKKLGCQRASLGSLGGREGVRHIFRRIRST